MKNVKLQAAREASGKTQAQVAKEAQVTERMYQQYEYGAEPGVRTAIRIADVIGIKSYKEFKQLFGAATPEEPTTKKIH